MKDVTPQQQRRNLLLALVLSAIILLGFDLVSYWGWGKHALMGWNRPVAEASVTAAPVAGNGSAAVGQNAQTVAPLAHNVVPLSAVKRVELDNGTLHLGYNLVGGKLDNVALNKFQAELGKPGGVQLLTDEGKLATWVDSGWQAPAGMQAPDSATTWEQANSPNMGEAHTLVMTYKNTSGQTFQRTFAPRPGSYLIDVTDRVWNTAQLPVTLRHYARVNRTGGADPHERSSWVNYSGPMGEVGEIIREGKFADLKKTGRSESYNGDGGWWGITGQYFMTAILPDVTAQPGAATDASSVSRDFTYSNAGGTDLYSADLTRDVSVPAGGQAEVRYSIFAGPKAQDVLESVGQGLPRAIDWGWFAVIAKPLHRLLVWLHTLLHSWGLAIFSLTLLLKAITYPLAGQTYRSMAKMKKLQPELKRLQELHSGDRQTVALKTMELYAREKVSPLGGCWPTLIQIPIFFAMYKVVLVSFEMRQAPLFGLWIHDLSVMDPFYILPVLMGLSMYVQMQMNPPAADPSQQLVFKFMPIMFTVMFLSFPAGLVFYWLCNNVLTVAQQYYIMKKHGR